MLTYRKPLIFSLFNGLTNAGIISKAFPIDVSSLLASQSADPTISSLVASATASESLGARPYMKPSNKVVEVLAIGDSFTAGIGSNGDPDRLSGSGDCSRYKKAWPIQLVAKDGWKDFNRDLPKLTFGACSGATMHNKGGLDNNGLVENQLGQGYEDRDIPYIRIGKPQIAVLTITGNDVGFSAAIKACVYRPLPGFNAICDDTLNDVSDKIKSAKFKAELVETIVKIVVAGRIAEGSNPPENFQVYLAGYVGFWNHDDPGCDNVSWSWFLGDRQWLTRDLRKRMNDLVDQLNDVIKSVAGELAASGVIYVEGHQGAYGSHRYCEPAPSNYHWSEVGAQTWFWHQDSVRYKEGDEGSASSSANITQIVLDVLIPDKNVQASISKDNPPGKIHPAFRDWDSLEEALKQAGNVAKNDSSGILASY
ncbi:MAG: hypothetical protein M1820_001971 [Bogoriella megaspora]|nr:MAG: hypothetical protein M1820_001971 [Bogoriella megaspora]